MRHRLRSLVVALSLLALALPAPALAKGEFHPEDEFELHPWISIEIGPLDLSINKAVVYLLLAALVTFLLGIFLFRFRLATDPDQAPDRRRVGLRDRAGAGRGAGPARQGDQAAGSRTSRP